MWLITLLVLAVIAFFLVKFVTGKASQQDSSSSGAQIHNNHPPADKNTAPDVSQTAQSSSSANQESNSLSGVIVDTGNMQNDVQEMIKILNLAPSDASRLSLSRDAFSALTGGDVAFAPSADELSVAATKLRRMLA
jgi:redox-sensitive bicupin YhaK (pirin superfamily)